MGQTIAHVSETGGGRRTWLRRLANVARVHLLRSAAYNLGLLLHKVWGMGKPRSGGAGWATAVAAVAGLFTASGRPWDAFDVLTTVTGVVLVFLIVRRTFGRKFSLLSTESRKSGPS